MADQLNVLRVPKTGSGTLEVAYRHIAQMRRSHAERLRDMPDGTIIGTIRDPIDRFRSAFAMYWRDGNAPVREYGDINGFIAAGPGLWMSEVYGSAFWPQTYWYESAEYVRERGAIVIPTKELSAYLEERRLSVPVHESVRHPGYYEPEFHTLDKESVITLRQAYAGDYALIRDLGLEGRV